LSSDPRAGLLLAVPMPLILIGRDERVVAANDMARKIFAGAAPGRHYTGALRAPELVDCVETALRAGQSASVRHLATDRGRDVTWRVMAAPVSPAGDKAGEGAEVLVSFEDISEIEAAGRMRRDFVANVSHELKTPLTALTGFIETLRGPARDDPAARDRFLGIMAHEVARMNRLVDDLLSLTRVESQERLRPTSPVELERVLAGVLSALEPLAEKRGVGLRLANAGGQVVVPGDADQLAQVFTNLVENALKYASGGGLVEIAVKTMEHEPVLDSPAVAVSVTDRGSGFEALHIPRLTERFYRIDAHRSRDEGGTGLGLAIVKHIVNRHRGRLRIESWPGKGSRFTVTLPQG